MKVDELLFEAAVKPFTKGGFQGDGFYLCDKEPLLDEESEGAEGLVAKALNITWDEASELIEKNDAKLNKFVMFNTYGSGCEYGLTDGAVTKVIRIGSPYVFSREPESDAEERRQEKAMMKVQAVLVSMGFDENEAMEAIQNCVQDADKCMVTHKLGNKHLLLVVTDD